MSVVYFDGKHHVFTDSILTNGFDGTHAIDKVIKLPYLDDHWGCFVGIAGVCALYLDNFQDQYNSNQNPSKALSIPLSVERKEHGEDCHVIIIDRKLDCLWYYSDTAHAFTKMKMGEFTIGHPRAVGAVQATVALLGIGWKRDIADVLHNIDHTATSCNRVTAGPYHIYDLKQDTHTVSNP